MYSSDKNTKSPGKYCILFKTTKICNLQENGLQIFIFVVECTLVEKQKIKDVSKCK